MDLSEIKALTDIFGAGGGGIVALGMLVMGLLIPVFRRERQQAKEPAPELVKDADVLVFMTAHELRVKGLEQRVEKLERKCGD